MARDYPVEMDFPKLNSSFIETFRNDKISIRKLIQALLVAEV